MLDLTCIVAVVHICNYFSAFEIFLILVKLPLYGVTSIMFENFLLCPPFEDHIQKQIFQLGLIVERILIGKVIKLKVKDRNVFYE